MDEKNKRIAFFTNTIEERDKNHIYLTRQSNMREFLAATKGDVAASIDLTLMSDRTLRSEVNAELIKRGSQYQFDYTEIFNVLGEETPKRASGVYEDVTPLTAANMIPTTVSDYITNRAEALGQVFSLVDHQTQVTGYNKILRFLSNPIAKFVIATQDLPNITSPIDGPTLNPHRYGAYISIANELATKVNASNILALIDKLAEAAARCQDSIIFNGTGVNEPLGILANATAITAGTDLFATITNGAAALGDQNNIDISQLTVVFNTAVWGLAVRTARLGNNMANWMTFNAGDGKISSTTGMICGIKYVVTQALKSTGNAGSQVAPIVIGRFSDYAWRQAESLTLKTDNISGMIQGVSKYAIEGIADGLPVYNDSFAKINVTTGL